MGLRLENVTAAYNQTVVLENISLAFKMDQINAIIGTSGSGKTTLVEIIAMFQKPIAGTVTIGGNKKVGFVFEFPDKQFFCMTVADELKCGLKNKNNQKKISDVLIMVGLNDSYLNKNPHHLSNGEKRRVAIAAILIANPDIIIFDEPTVGLDRNSKQNLVRIMKMLKQKYKKTIIIVSQDIDFVYSFVDFVYILHDKKLVQYGEKTAVLSDVNQLKKYNIAPPKIVELTQKINQTKNLKLMYRDDINDLLKDMYRHAK